MYFFDKLSVLVLPKVGLFMCIVDDYSVEDGKMTWKLNDYINQCLSF